MKKCISVGQKQVFCAVCRHQTAFSGQKVRSKSSRRSSSLKDRLGLQRKKQRGAN